MGRKLSTQDVVSKVMTESMKQLKKKFGSVKNEKRLLKKTNEELMRNYGAQNTVVGKSMWKLMKSVST